MNQLSVILPVYNEKETLGKVLKEWKKELELLNISHQFIICEDGSTDGTKELLSKIQKKYKLIINQKKERRGYGGAVIDGMKESNSRYILSIDSDGQCDPADFEAFWQARKQADVIIGWRTARADALQRKIFSFFFKSAFKLMFPTSLHDPSAPFVLYQKKTFIPYLYQLSFLKEGFWWGFVGTCIRRGINLYELPINHRERFAGDTQVYHLKKIPSIAIRNLVGLIRLRFTN